MHDLSVSLIQDELDWQDAEANRRRYSKHIQSLPETDLIVLPEMFNTGFCMQPKGIHETMNGETVGWLRKRAEECGAVITGSMIVDVDGEYRNRMIWARPDGSVTFYDKRHLFRYGEEHIHYTAGRDRVIVDLNGWRLALFVCYDLRFPVWSRNREDYDVAVYVANWPNARQYAWDTLLRSRAIENQCYVLGVNRLGSDQIGNDFSGGTAILDFMGRPLVDCKDSLKNATALLSMQKLREFKAEFPAHLDADDFSINV